VVFLTSGFCSGPKTTGLDSLACRYYLFSLEKQTRRTHGLNVNESATSSSILTLRYAINFSREKHCPEYTGRIKKGTAGYYCTYLTFTWKAFKGSLYKTPFCTAHVFNRASNTFIFHSLYCL